MLEVKHLSVSYKKGGGLPVLKDFSCEVEKGHVLAVAGPSGCGKSTLLRVIAGILKPESGEVCLDGTLLRPDRCSIGLIPQNYGLLPWKTVMENGLFCAKAGERNTRGIKACELRRDQERELTEICRKLGIADLLARYPGSLSGGQAQRAALARAFFMRPELLLMDEPFSALDISAAAAARELFLELWKESRPTTVIVTHWLEDALYLAGRIVVMGKNGRIAFWCGNPWQGLKSPVEEGYGRLKQQLMDEIIKADCV